MADEQSASPLEKRDRRHHRRLASGDSNSPGNNGDHEGDHPHHRKHRRSSHTPPTEKSKRKHRSRSSSRHRHRRRQRHRQSRESSSSEDSRTSKSSSRDAGGKGRLKSKFELKSEKLKVVSNVPTTPQQSPTSATATKLVEEINKRKLIFGKKPAEPSTSAQSLWERTKFSDDPDGNVQAKFKRLMGIKSNGVPPTSSSSCSSLPSVEEKIPSTGGKVQQQQYFSDLEKQYEVARVATHAQRGLGLGFSSRTERERYSQ